MKITFTKSERIVDALFAVRGELEMALENYPVFNSSHEGYAVILEELDKLKAQVWLRGDRRDCEKLREQAKTVSAMALRFMVEICDEGRGRI